MSPTIWTPNELVWVPCRQRRLNYHGTGREHLRKAILLTSDGEVAGSGTTCWLSDRAHELRGEWQPLSDGFPARLCCQEALIAPGTLVLDIERQIKRYRYVGSPRFVLMRVDCHDGQAECWYAAIDHVRAVELATGWQHTILVHGRVYTITG